jgi:hypothetical protein
VDPNVVLPLLSSVLSFAFAVLVFDQWLRRRQPFQLVWAVGLALYGLATATEFLGGGFGWNEPLYRAWYLCGALSVAAYLGLGTIHLLNRTRFGYFVAFSLLVGGLVTALAAAARSRAGEPVGPMVAELTVGAAVLGAIVLAAVTAINRRHVAWVATAMLIGASSVAAVLTLSAPIDAPGYALDPASGVPVPDALPSYLRILSPPFNITGGFALVFGALYSAYIFMPKRRVLRVDAGPPVLAHAGRAIAVVVNFVASIPGSVRAARAGGLHSRVPATLLIALGGFIPGLVDGLTRFGITWGFFLGQLLGVVLIFIGFLVSIEVFSDVRLPFTRIVLARRERSARGARGETGEAGSRP